MNNLVSPLPASNAARLTTRSSSARNCPIFLTRLLLTATTAPPVRMTGPCRIALHLLYRSICFCTQHCQFSPALSMQAHTRQYLILPDPARPPCVVAAEAPPGITDISLVIPSLHTCNCTFEPGAVSDTVLTSSPALQHSPTPDIRMMSPVCHSPLSGGKPGLTDANGAPATLSSEKDLLCTFHDMRIA
jgi:hypothetical protein